MPDLLAILDATAMTELQVLKGHLDLQAHLVSQEEKDRAVNPEDQQFQRQHSQAILEHPESQWDSGILFFFLRKKLQLTV